MEYTQCVVYPIALLYALTARLGNSGLKISKVVLGCMTFGTSKWQDWVLDEDKSLPIIEHAYKNGINTWDTVRLLTIPLVPLRLSMLEAKPLIGGRLLARPVGGDSRKGIA